MENITPIVDMLDRDNALELDNQEQTYEEGQEPVTVDWDTLFPGRKGERGEEDWEVNEDPGQSELPGDVIGEILEGIGSKGNVAGQPLPPYPADIENADGAIWDICAWYQPIHYFGYNWGIYIREDCLIRQAAHIAGHLRTNPRTLTSQSAQLLAKDILRSSFASFFLHEHFHHKVESLGLRMHVVLARSAYLAYKKNVYRPSYLTDDCLEEAMANAYSFRRLATQPYRRLIEKDVLNATRMHLEATFNTDPPGYRMALRYLTKGTFDSGACLLQGQVKEALLKPAQASRDWLAAKQLLRSYFSIHSNIYTVVPMGKRPILPSKVIPKTCSTSDMVKLYKSRGYTEVPGGKGSHVKLKKPGAPTMHLPGNRKSLSPGVLDGALKNLGNYTFNDLDQLLSKL